MKKIINKNLVKYNFDNSSFNSLIIKSIIFDQKTHLVTEFKNFLLWDEFSEFLKRFYYLKESKNRIPKITKYYCKYTFIYPNYLGNEGKIVVIMNKYVRRKKRYYEYIEDNEDNINKKKKNNENFEKIIKDSLINDNNTILTNDLTKYEYNKNNSLDLSEIMNK